MKSIIIGLDGATFDLLWPWLEDGHLPCLSRLLEKGVYGPLQSIIPPISGPAWVSFATGKDPSNHGIVSFLRNPTRRPGEADRRVISRTSFQDASFWEILSQAGMRVGVINVPVTYPPYKVNGFMITSFLTPPSTDIFYYPEDLKSELQDYKICSGFTNTTFFSPWAVGDTIEKERKKLYQEVSDIARIRTTTAINLIRKWEPDLFIMVYKETDDLQHFFWHDKGLLLRFYQEIDQYLEKILRLADDKTHVMIVSDHGFGPSPNRLFFLNKWLRDQGYLRMKKNFSPLLYHWFYNIVKKLKTKISLLSDPLIHVKKGLNISLGKLWNQVDWQKTLAWGQSLGMEIQGIYMNQDNITDYAILRQEIMEQLGRLLDGKNKNLFQGIYKREDLYQGLFLKKIPDIVLLPKPEYSIMDNPAATTLFEDLHPRLSGCHKTFRKGIFIAHGPDIKHGGKVEGMQLIDVAPTILHMLNTPVPEDMNGRVLKEIFRDDSEAAKRRIDYQKITLSSKKLIQDGDRISDQDDQEIKNRLRALGYM